MQVAEHIHAIRIPFQVTTPAGITVDRFVYVYLIYGKAICLIDSGVASAESAIFDYVRQTGRKPEEISLLVQTHSHPDHIGATQAIKKATGCAVAAHSGEKAWIEDVHLQARQRPVPGFHSLVEGPAKVDRVLEEGDVLDLGDGLSLEVFHTPGHSKGSISLWFEADSALFSGDAIPTPGDMPIYDDVIASVRSINKLMKNRGIKLLLSSWDTPREGNRAYQVMDEGLSYLQRIHEAVIKVAGHDDSLEPLELSRRVLGELGIPQMAANPLIARSFQANLEVRDQQDLLGDQSGFS